MAAASRPGSDISEARSVLLEAELPVELGGAVPGNQTKRRALDEIAAPVRGRREAQGGRRAAGAGCGGLAICGGSVARAGCLGFGRSVRPIQFHTASKDGGAVGTKERDGSGGSGGHLRACGIARNQERYCVSLFRSRETPTISSSNGAVPAF